MSNYRRGAAFEYERLEFHRNNGAIFVCRTAGSHSPFDVIAIYEDEVILEQLKRSKKKSPSYKQELAQMKDMNLPIQCTKRFLLRRDGDTEPILLYEG